MKSRENFESIRTPYSAYFVRTEDIAKAEVPLSDNDVVHNNLHD